MLKTNKLVIALNRLHQALGKALLNFKREKGKAEIKAQIDKIKRIVFIRNDALGDLAVTTPLIFALAERYEVVVYANKENVPMLKTHQHYTRAKNVKIKTVEKKHMYRNGLELGFHLLLSLIFFPFIWKKTKEKTTLILDAKGYPLEASSLPESKESFIVGPNKGVVSVFYDYFLDTSLSLSGKHVLSAYLDLLNEVGIALSAEDVENEMEEPEGEEKGDEIGILLTCKPERQISPKLWVEIIRGVMKHGEVVLIDDPSQAVMKAVFQLLSKEEQNKVKRLTPMPLPELKKKTRNLRALISLDGGAQHYLGQALNELVIYTSGLAPMWKPFTTSKWEKKEVRGHIIEWTTTKKGLRKVIVYKKMDCRPCFLPCGTKECRRLNPSVVRKALDLLLREAH